MKLPVLAAIAALHAGVAWAGDIMAKEPFAYATTASQKAGAAFVTVMTQGGPDNLVGAESDAAKRVEIHTHVSENDVMKMRKVDGPLPLSADAPIEMKPGGVHVMLMGLNAPLTAGETLPVTLVFEDAGPVEVQVPIIKRGDKPMGGHNHGKSGG